MATKKDALHEITAEMSKTKALSRKWRSRQPAKADFDLEGVDINEIYGRRQHFYAEKDKEVERMTKEIPSDKERISLEFGWEGWSMLILCIVLFIYIKMFGMPGHTGQIIISALCILIVGMYTVRASHKKHMRKLEIEEMKAERDRVRRAPFKDEETYQRVVDYAEALYDYEEWQKRRNKTYWKDMHSDDAREVMFSIYDMLGYEPEGTYDEHLDFIAIDNEGELGVMCPGSRKLTAQMVESFAYDLQDNKLNRGIIYATGMVDAGAKTLCTPKEDGTSPLGGVNIVIQGIDDIMALNNTADQDDKK